MLNLVSSSLRLFVFLLLTFATIIQPGNAQVLDNSINWEIHTQALYADNNYNPVGPEQIAFLIDVYQYDNENWTGETCIHVQADGATTFSPYREVVAVGYDDNYEAQYTFDMRAWGEVGTPDCTINGLDNNALYMVADEQGLQDKFTIPGTGSAGLWSSNWSSQTNNWIFNNYTYDMRMQSTWRYARGETMSDPMDFGTLISGSSSKSHINWNRPIPDDASGSFVGYQNNGFRPSPDVFYRFELTEAAEITVHTNDEMTDFDTYLTLLDASGNIIDQNDDIGGGNTKSEINTTLCAGVYFVVVDGYNLNDVGRFGLRLLKSSSGMFTVQSSVDPVSCPGGNDASIVLNPMNGIPPYTYTWSDGSTASTRNNLTEGSYDVTVTDACNNWFPSNIIIFDDDSEIPTANCTDLFVDIEEGSTYIVDATALGANSTDNCGIVSYVASPETIGAFSGFTTVYLTVTDAAGNTDNCVGAVTTSLITSIQDHEQALAFNVFPNPATDWVTLNFTDLDLSASAQVAIRDMNGSIVWESAVDNRLMKADLSNLSSGVYLVELRDGSFTGHKKLVLH